MGIWIFILIAVLSVTGIGIIYMTRAVGKFGLIRKISGEKNWLRRLISFGCISLSFTILCFIFSLVNSIIIFLHVFLFWVIFDLVLFFVRKASKKEIRINLSGWLSLGLTAVYLAVGYYLCHNVWITNYTIETDKDIGELRVVMFADSHIGTTFDGEELSEHVKSINEQNPDIVIIAGDFIDDGTDKENMIKACESLGEIDAKYGVWYSYGNHDRGYNRFEYRGYGAEDLEAELEKNGVRVLVDESELVDDRFYVVGRGDAGFQDRKDISELTRDLDTSKYIIVIDHQPVDYDSESKSPADLVLSGHTHGGQFFPITHLGFLIGVNDRTYGYENRNGTDFIVTSGIADWELKFKTGTKSEFTVIDIK